ncbi:MAG: hypothetical protein C0597_09565 [Marinilabiliales bacterium]|nr:MAG: hypothetical protein C0597_09565 [Marinilabiliales bacterium]
MEQKNNMDLPILLFLGTNDPIVGDSEFARKAAQDYPNIEVYESESGHLIGSEYARFVNEKISEFLLNN